MDSAARFNNNGVSRGCDWKFGEALEDNKEIFSFPAIGVKRVHSQKEENFFI